MFALAISTNSTFKFQFNLKFLLVGDKMSHNAKSMCEIRLFEIIDEPLNKIINKRHKKLLIHFF